MFRTELLNALPVSFCFRVVLVLVQCMPAGSLYVTDCLRICIRKMVLDKLNCYRAVVDLSAVVRTSNLR